MNTEFLRYAVLFVNYVSLFYVVIISILYLLQLVLAAVGLRKYMRTLRYTDYEMFDESENMVPISLLVPAYNEEASIVDSIQNLLNLNFPEYEVIVINDGSKDGTMELLVETFALVPVNQPYKRSIDTEEINGIYRSSLHVNLIVVDKENGGKADALNAGINISGYPVFVSIDADSALEKDSLIKIIYSFISDPNCMAVGGIVRIGSGCKMNSGQIQEIGLSSNPLVMLQTTEYLRAFLAGRIGFATVGMLLIISGAFGAFNKNAVIEVGGYTRNCIGEDMELVIKIHKAMRKKKRKYSIKFIPDPICWTQPPETYRDLRKQRKRWHVGLINGLMRHLDMVFNPCYGRIGMFCMPYYWLFEVAGPIMETIGYITVPVSYILGLINIKFMISFFILSVLYGTILSVGTLFLEENTFQKYPEVKQLLKLFFFSLIDNFGYRQVNALFKVEAMLGYRKNKTNWGELKRKGFEHMEEKDNDQAAA